MLEKDDKIGDHTLIRFLGRGQFGEVWLAEKQVPFSNQKFRHALKFLSNSEEVINLGAAEAEIATWIEASGHPNVMPVIDMIVHGTYVIIVSEFADGGSLKDWLKRCGGKAPTHEKALEMVIGVLRGIEHLHSRSVVHRDLKPDNILLQGDSPRITDFGISRIISENTAATNAGGSPLYMSPEAFLGSKAPQTDIWSAGVILYEMVTGTFPFRADNVFELSEIVRNKQPKPLPDDVPLEIKAVIARALQKDRGDRFQSALEMRTAVEEASDHLRQSASGETIRQFSVPTVTRSTSRAKFGVGAALAVIAALAIAVVLFMVWNPWAEATAWGLVQGSEDPAAFREFLREFPTGAYAEQAKLRMDHLVWTAARNSNSRAMIRAYLNEFPRGVNVNSARAKERQLEGARDAATTRGSPSSEPVRKNSIGLELVFIPPGEFLMGSSDSEIDDVMAECQKANLECERKWFVPETPKHAVTLKGGFWLGRFEVTQGQWQAVMGANPSEHVDCGSDCPVENISWDEAQSFIKKLNEANDGFRYSLPTEAEWEYAARADATTVFPSGNSLSSTQANFDGNVPYASDRGVDLGKTTRVGSYEPNVWGLYDMSGNVWEWVQDLYTTSYEGLSADGSANNARGDPGKRSMRGGSFKSWSFYARPAMRSADQHSARDIYLRAARGRAPQVINGSRY